MEQRSRPSRRARHLKPKRAVFLSLWQPPIVVLRVVATDGLVLLLLRLASETIWWEKTNLYLLADLQRRLEHSNWVCPRVNPSIAGTGQPSSPPPGRYVTLDLVYQ